MYAMIRHRGRLAVPAHSPGPVWRRSRTGAAGACRTKKLNTAIAATALAACVGNNHLRAAALASGQGPDRPDVAARPAATASSSGPKLMGVPLEQPALWRCRPKLWRRHRLRRPTPGKDHAEGPNDFGTQRRRRESRWIALVLLVAADAVVAAAPDYTTSPN